MSVPEKLQGPFGAAKLNSRVSAAGARVERHGLDGRAVPGALAAREPDEAHLGERRHLFQFPQHRARDGLEADSHHQCREHLARDREAAQEERRAAFACG